MLHILTDAADFQMCILTSKILLNIFTSSILIILDKDADENVVKYLQYISMGFLSPFYSESVWSLKKNEIHIVLLTKDNHHHHPPPFIFSYQCIWSQKGSNKVFLRLLTANTAFHSHWSWMNIFFELFLREDFYQISKNILCLKQLVQIHSSVNAFPGACPLFCNFVGSFLGEKSRPWSLVLGLHLSLELGAFSWRVD